VHYRLRTAKSINLIIKFYLYLTIRKSDFSWVTIPAWSFVLTRDCNLTWERNFRCGPYQMYTRAAGSPALVYILYIAYGRPLCSCHIFIDHLWRSKGGKREDCPGYPTSEITKIKFITMLQLDASSYCKANNTYCMDLMETCLKGEFKLKLSDPRERDMKYCQCYLKPYTPVLFPLCRLVNSY